jgi:hypothetical protein
VPAALVNRLLIGVSVVTRGDRLQKKGFVRRGRRSEVRLHRFTHGRMRYARFLVRLLGFPCATNRLAGELRVQRFGRRDWDHQLARDFFFGACLLIAEARLFNRCIKNVRF